MEKEIKLLGCPFCGSGDIACEVLDDGWKFVESCRTCKARGPMYRTMVEALKGWNTRPAADQSRVIEALEQEVYRLNNHDMHLDIGGMAEDVAAQCPVCQACERIWAVIHPEDINPNGDEK